MFAEGLPVWTRDIARKVAASWGIDVAEEAEFTWRNAPSLMTFCVLCFIVAWLTAGMPESARASRASDFGDVAHALYLPHVDIFRADGFLAQAVRQAKLPLATTVVSRVSELIEAVEKRLSAS